MSGLYLATITTLIGALAVTLWGFDQQTIRANRAEGDADQARQLADDAFIDLAAETRAHAATKERLAIAEVVTDTLAADLAEALRIDQDQAAGTPIHDATITSIFRKQLEGPSAGWPL